MRLLASLLLALMAAALSLAPAQAACVYIGANCYEGADPNNFSYMGASPMTVGGSAISQATRGVSAECTAGGDVTLKMADGSSLVWGVSVGFQFQPFAATQVTTSTAICTYQGLR